MMVGLMVLAATAFSLGCDSDSQDTCAPNSLSGGTMPDFQATTTDGEECG